MSTQTSPTTKEVGIPSCLNIVGIPAPALVTLPPPAPCKAPAAEIVTAVFLTSSLTKVVPLESLTSVPSRTSLFAIKVPVPLRRRAGAVNTKLPPEALFARGEFSIAVKVTCQKLFALAPVIGTLSNVQLAVSPTKVLVLKV